MALVQFNNGSRPGPSPSRTREIGDIVQHLRSGRIDTSTRFGRKPQWKDDQKKKFIETLLEGNIPVDAVSISQVSGIDRCINGNNRMRALLDFAENRYGIDILDEEGHKHVYYYSVIPEFERANPKRNRTAHILPDLIREAFDRYPLHMNVRNNLTESQEVDWYRKMNKNMAPHSPGQILVTILCNPDEDNETFVTSMLTKFPQVKVRVNEPITDEDAEQPGGILADLFGVDIDILDTENKDKKEYTIMSIACIHNLMVNGKPYHNGFQGTFDEATVEANYEKLMEIFEDLTFSEETKEYFREGVSSGKKFLPTVWSPSFMLGPIAWSIATNKPDAVRVWGQFLTDVTQQKFEDTYIMGVTDDDKNEFTKRRKMADSSPRKYEIAWERVSALYQ